MKKSFVTILCCLLLSFSCAYGQEAALKPRCSADADCQKEGMRGICQNPGQSLALCVFLEVTKIHLQVIVPQACRSCHTETFISNLKALFPGLEVEYIDEADARAAKIIKDFRIEMLPAFILSKDVEQDPNFESLKQAADFMNDQYYVKPFLSGVSYFLNRPMNAGQLDLFVQLTQPQTASLLKIAREIQEQKKDGIKFQLHLVGAQNPETQEFLSPEGLREINEDKIYACVDKYYPAMSWDYLSCRAGNINNPWINDCLNDKSIDVAKIKECSQGPESQALLKEKIKLAEELQIAYAPLFLLDNVEIFGATEQTTANEVIKVMELKPTKDH